ncbi:MAG: CsbD family protein [Actinomycetota bacterium]|nr:CsbD family protein [Actinomycetota bacterium]
MPRIPHVSPKNATGLVDKFVGLYKEVVGTVFDNDKLKKSGQLQQEAGTEKIKAIQAEVEASSHKAKAASAQSAEKSAQRSKVDA